MVTPFWPAPWKEELRSPRLSRWLHFAEQTRLHFAERYRAHQFPKPGLFRFTEIAEVAERNSQALRWGKGEISSAFSKRLARTLSTAQGLEPQWIRCRAPYRGLGVGDHPVTLSGHRRTLEPCKAGLEDRTVSPVECRNVLNYHEAFLPNFRETEHQVLVILDEDEAGRAGRDDIAVRLSKFLFVKIHAFPQEGDQPDDLTLDEVAAIKSGEA